MLDKRERAYRAQLRRCYKCRERQPTKLMQAADVFSDLLARRNRRVNGNYRPGKAWLRRRLELARELVKAAK